MNTELFSSRQGFLYLLTNPSMPGLVKCGATRKHPLQRAKELCAGTGVPTPFVLAYYRDFSDAFAAESLVHEAFADYRINTAREFFQADVEGVIRFVDALATSSDYREMALTSDGVTGGERSHVAARSRMPATPFADLFASFDPDGPLELTPEEQTQCRALESSLTRRG